MVFSLFQRKNQVKSVDSHLAIFSAKISEAFSRIREDISSSDQRHNSTEDELQKLNQWVGYLYNNQQSLSNNHSRLADRHAQLTAKHSKLDRSHSSLSKSIDLKHSQLSSDISGNHRLTDKELEHVKDWIKHFSGKIENQRDIEAKLRKDVLTLQSQFLGVMSELKEEVDNLKTENAHIKLAVAEPKIIEVEKPTPIAPLPVQDVPISSPAQNKFEQKILARVRPNRKNFVMQQILDLVEDNKYSTRDIEEIIVNEKQLCGRTSFYSYLKELKHKGKINYADLGDRTVLVLVNNQ